MADRLTFTAPVELQAAPAKEGEPAKRPSFEMVAYTGVAMNAGGFYSPVVVELSGVKTANETIPILLDHDASQIIGQGSAKVDSATIRVSGEVMGDSEQSRSVVALAKDGFKWQASIGATVTRREFLEAGKKAMVNGREVNGPLVIARESLLQEVSFVAIGADHQTSAAVAASHSPGKGLPMEPQFKAWLEANGYANSDTLSEQQLKPLQAAWKAETATPEKPPVGEVSDVFASARTEAARKTQIAELTAKFLGENAHFTAAQIAQVEVVAGMANEGKWSGEKYEYELLKATRQQSTVFRPSITHSGSKVTNRVIEAAVCMAGRLPGHEEMFKDEELQAAHDQFRNGIGLKQIILKCAEARGYRGDYSGNVTIEAQRAAFGMTGVNQIQAAGGFSPLDISTIVSATANKFLSRGFNAVDMTPLRISRIKSVRNFQQITTVSLTGAGMFEQLGPGGEIKHKSLGEQTYTNQADTYAGMLAITRKDIINDDLSALTDAPMKLGRGAGLKLNDIFWTEWLGAEGAGFFAAGNNNINTGVADMTVGGLEATEVIFLNQTDYDGYPLSATPAILVVPTALKSKALTLMDSEKIVTGSDVTKGDSNPFKGRFRVESSPYMSNSSYTGYSAAEWYMIADPNELAVIEIVALNGRVEPTVEQADADFNVLGIQMRGYSDVGVNLQEKKAGVLADGGTS